MVILFLLVPQEYFVSYEYITEDLKLTYPIGGESIVPGSQEIIRWDTHSQEA